LKRRLALALALLLPAALAWAQDTRGPRPSPSSRPTGPQLDEPAGNAELSEDALRAIESGLRKLKGWQQESGGWLSIPSNYRMSVTALAGLAFLAHGDSPGRGEYGETLQKAIDFILTHQKPENDPHSGVFFDMRDMGENDRVMHGHGFALLFLAEAYGQSSNPQLRARIHQALVRAVKLTERTQSEEGGWYYLPGDRRDEGSVTITQIQGLRAARNAGIVVSKGTIDRAVDYIRRSQIPTGDHAGGVRYTSRYGEPSPALTAAGIAVYYGAGEGSP
jgi:hypothetical protein